MQKLSGVIAGYDPGGNGKHGLALGVFLAGKCESLEVSTLGSAEAVLDRIEAEEKLVGIGIDTLTAWCTGRSGWRPADRWLRRTYTDVQQSVSAPGSLAGSMGINGMAVLVELRRRNPGLSATETHPKVLYRALSGAKYRYADCPALMDQELSKWLDADIYTRNDHEWDAIASVLATAKGLSGEWKIDLHRKISNDSGRLIFPAKETNYWWPSEKQQSNHLKQVFNIS